jgi:vacuolar iron transporter family protein
MLTHIRKYIGEIVYGSIDGTVTTFAIIAGAAAASLSPEIVLILGFSNVLADGFSMASSNYLSAKAAAERDGSAHTTREGILASTATFLSFITIGSIPVLPYICTLLGMIDRPFFISIIATGVTFIGIGYVRGFVTGSNSVRAAIETLCIGAVAALVAYGVGAWIDSVVH